MTQEEVARKAGMPQSTISRIEGLTHGLPKLSTLKKIANALMQILSSSSKHEKRKMQ